MSEYIEVANCPQCGAPIKLNSNKCEYCDSEFLLTSLAYLDKVDRTGINKYINHYKQLLKKNPDNGELNCAMGICYLDLGLYDLSTKYFAKAIEQIADYSDAYYYYALVLLKGKRPKVLTLTEIKKIENYLNAAIQLDDSKSKYYYLWAIIRYDFYIKNGLKINSPTFEDLINNANQKSYEKSEIEKLLQRIPIKDQYIINSIRR